MNNLGKPALYGLTNSTIGTFFSENHLIRPLAKLKNYVLIAQKTRGRNQVSSDKSLII
jgi:hypothetical protein